MYSVNNCPACGGVHFMEELEISFLCPVKNTYVTYTQDDLDNAIPKPVRDDYADQASFKAACQQYYTGGNY